MEFGDAPSPACACYLARRRVVAGWHLLDRLPPRFFLPVKVLSQLFRCLLFDGLTRLHKAGKLKFFGDLVGLADQISSLPASRPCAKSTGFSVCGLVKRVSVASVRGHCSLRGHGRRVCPCLMMVFGGGSSPMSFADCAATAASQPFVRKRSTSVPSTARQAHPEDAAERGTSLPASPAGIQIRQRPPLSIDIRFRSSTASA